MEQLLNSESLAYESSRSIDFTRSTFLNDKYVHCSVDTASVVDQTHNLYAPEYDLPERKVSISKRTQQKMRQDNKKQDGACMGACKQQWPFIFYTINHKVFSNVSIVFWNKR